MEENTLKLQCEACGGALQFDTTSQNIVCEFCGTEYAKDHFTLKKEVEEMEAFEREQNNIIKEDAKVDWRIEGFVKERESLDGQTGYSCTSCGAEIVSDQNTVATECMYCGNPVVLNDNSTGMLKPDLIIPFKINKAQAEKTLKEFYNKKFLLPKAFKDKNRISKITGMYVPFWLYSGQGSGYIQADGRKVRTHRSGDIETTTTSHYNVIREGTLNFNKVPVDASIKMEDRYMDGLEPFNYNDLVEFEPTYMAGFFGDKFDVNVDECAVRAEKRVTESTKNIMSSTIKGYTSAPLTNSDIKLVANDVRYALLPVWVLNTKYNDVMYHFAINGQTGKVSGDLPIDKNKKRWLRIGLIAAAYVPLALISYLMFF